MRTLILAVLAINLTACGIIPAMYDRNDPCQIHNKPAGYQKPNYCGAGGGVTTYQTRDFMTGNYRTTTTQYNK